jgi:hypothetical protein
MLRRVTIAIAAAMMSMFALIFWLGMDATDAAGAADEAYAVSSNPCLSVQRLEPVY